MATQRIDVVSSGPRREHEYHANAYVLSADLKQPVASEIPQQALVTLPEDGEFRFQRAKPFELFGVLSYISGYTQVAGHRSSVLLSLAGFSSGGAKRI